jgi:broad specificity phosphatase PhoE
MTEVPIKPFYIMRHGETVANIEGIVAGVLDTPLTQRGREQAEKVRAILTALSFKPKLIVHSDLSRTRDTATIINEKMKLPVLEKASISERNLGDWAGIPLKDYFDRCKSGLQPLNGEAMEAFEHRVMRGFGEILDLSNEPILIITHAGVFRAFVTYYGYKSNNAKNCALYAFTPETGNAQLPWKIEQIN